MVWAFLGCLWGRGRSQFLWKARDFFGCSKLSPQQGGRGKKIDVEFAMDLLDALVMVGCMDRDSRVVGVGTSGQGGARWGAPLLPSRRLS